MASKAMKAGLIALTVAGLFVNGCGSANQWDFTSGAGTLVDEGAPADDALQTQALLQTPLSPLTREDIQLFVSSHAPLAAKVDQNPELMDDILARVDSVFDEFTRAPRAVFVQEGENLAYPMTAMVNFQADMLLKTEAGTLAMLKTEMSAPGISFTGIPDSGVFIGFVLEPYEGAEVTLEDLELPIYNGYSTLNSLLWDAYLGHLQFFSGGFSGPDLVLANAGFDKFYPQELWLQSATLDVQEEVTFQLFGSEPAPRAPWPDAVLQMAGDGFTIYLTEGILSLVSGDDQVQWQLPVPAETLAWLDLAEEWIGLINSDQLIIVDLDGDLVARLIVSGPYPFDIENQSEGEATALATCELLAYYQAQVSGFMFGLEMLDWTLASSWYDAWSQYLQSLSTDLGCFEP